MKTVLVNIDVLRVDQSLILFVNVLMWIKFPSMTSRFVCPSILLRNHNVLWQTVVVNISVFVVEDWNTLVWHVTWIRTIMAWLLIRSFCTNFWRYGACEMNKSESIELNWEVCIEKLVIIKGVYWKTRSQTDALMCLIWSRIDEVESRAGRTSTLNAGWPPSEGAE